MWCTGLVALWRVESSQIRVQTCFSYIGSWILYHWATREALYHFCLRTVIFSIHGIIWNPSPTFVLKMLPVPEMCRIKLCNVCVFLLSLERVSTWESDTTERLHFHALEKEMANRSSVLAWRIPGTGEPGGLPSMGSHRVGHNWSDLAAAAAGWGIFVYRNVIFPVSLLGDLLYSDFYDIIWSCICLGIMIFTIF